MADSSTTAYWLRDGFYGPVTATLDWCEANYQFSYYIAEMANTLSNLFTINLGIWGALLAAGQSLPLRYIAGHAGIALVGIGSFAFHATLLFEAQLADELPMIYVGSMSLWFSFDVRPGYGFKTPESKFLVALLIAFDCLFTWTYIIYRNPVYHQMVFASIVLTTAACITYLLKWSDPTADIPDETKSTVGKLFYTGAALFVLGFFIWNMDNIFCAALTRWKLYVGWPTAFLLEGHSWWHILTGLGTHYMYIGIQYINLCLKDDHRNYTLGRRLGFPHVLRMDKRRL